MDGKPHGGPVRVGPLNPVSLVRREHKVVTRPQFPRLGLTLDQQLAAPESTTTHSLQGWSYQNPGGLACPVEMIRSMRNPVLATSSSIRSSRSLDGIPLKRFCATLTALLGVGAVWRPAAEGGLALL